MAEIVVVVITTLFEKIHDHLHLSYLFPMFSRLSVLSTLCCFLLLPMLSKLSVMPLDPPTTGVRFSAEDLSRVNHVKLYKLSWTTC